MSAPSIGGRCVRMSPTVGWPPWDDDGRGRPCSEDVASGAWSADQKEDGNEVTSNTGDMVGAAGARRDAGGGGDRPGEAVVAVPGGGPRSALQHGGQEDQESVHTADARREEVEHLRLLPAHEGRLLDRGRLRCGRGVTPTRRENAAGRGGRVHEPAGADQSDRKSVVEGKSGDLGGRRII